jgi:hypothetical protein
MGAMRRQRIDNRGNQGMLSKAALVPPFFFEDG